MMLENEQYEYLKSGALCLGWRLTVMYRRAMANARMRFTNTRNWESLNWPSLPVESLYAEEMRSCFV